MSSRLLLSVALGAVSAVLASQAEAQQAIELDTVTIDAAANNGAGSGAGGNGESATGPVTGYVAKRTATGSKTDTPLVEVPQSVSVIGREELEDRGVQKLDEALRYTPGVLSQPYGPDSDTDWIYIRGFNATQTGIYLDGLNLYSYAFGGFIIDPFLLERVELLRGPASVLYGGSNPGGLVNSVSKRANGERIRYVEGGIDDDPNGYGAFDIGDRFTTDGVWSYRLLGKVKGGDTDTEFADNFRGLIAPTVTFQPDADTRLNLYGSYQYDDQRHTTGFLPYVGTEVDAPFGRIDRDIFYSEPDLDRFRNRQVLLGYEFETAATDWLTLSSNTRYGHAERREYGPYFYGYADPTNLSNNYAALFAPPAGSDLLGRINFGHDTAVDTLTTDNRMVAEFEAGAIRHQILAGIDYKYFRIDQTQAVGYANPLSARDPVYLNSLPALGAPYNDSTTDLNQVGFYLQEQAKFGDGFILTLNGRYDQVRIDNDDRRPLSAFLTEQADYVSDDGAFSGRAGLGYEFKNGVVPYVSVSRFFNPQIGTDALGNGVPPETGEQYEVGVKYAPTFLDAVFTASLFDLTRRNTLQTDALFIPRAVGEIRSKGLELEANVNLDRNWKLVGAFTAFDLEITRDVDPTLVGNRPWLVPEVQASLWADYTVRDGALDGLGGGVGLRYVGDSFADNQNFLKVSDSTVVDAALRYDRANWGVSANVTNVFDEKAVSGCQNYYACGYIEGRGVLFKAHATW
ncbi:ligand-gated channel [Aureimonas endophytica]|uniref:Ligand-gated channel n=1 Tax=Aureimonas endophytica TaxID=2027858 RepID=A0A916ZU27_9HYPH|nr:TonB-dependent siderophore receptor [Aureimonas endophytica]GGE14117.1 ligand-gated channel [Aureimonas endophytica]